MEQEQTDKMFGHLGRFVTDPSAHRIVTDTIYLDCYQTRISEHHRKAFPELTGNLLLYALLDKLTEEITELDEVARLYELKYGFKKVYDVTDEQAEPLLDEVGDVLVVLLRLLELYGIGTFWLGEALDRSMKKFEQKYPAVDEEEDQDGKAR